MPSPTVCLNMIVKDEAPVVERALVSALPFIDSWLVVDTGSTDGTQDVVRAVLAGVPGELHERPWRNFAHNRNEALALARPRGDYAFFLDADDRLALPEGFARPALEADGYHLMCEDAGTRYSRCALVATRLPWRWKGVVHEYVACQAPHRVAALDGPTIVVGHAGARSRDPSTYARDAALLEEAVRADPENARDVFYLAQSLRDAGDLARSRDTYRRRAAMGGWEEEVWFALYQVACLGERLGCAPPEVAADYLAAFQYRPSRAEPLVQLARYHREHGQHALAHVYARHAASLARPADGLFVEDAAYGWRALDELAVAAYYVGALDEGRAAADRLLADARVPPAERARIARNRAFYGPA